MGRKRRSRKTPETANGGRYEIILAPGAVSDLHGLRAYDRSQVREAFEQYLRYQPTRTSNARIKRLQGPAKPQYRLRIGDDLRVFYDVRENRVEILAILSKQDVEEWLQREGVPE
jgi:mRNA-degrading endonuclease RelE of RelBE toxin-antitoxin system